MKSLFSLSTVQVALAGALGGFLGFLLGEIAFPERNATSDIFGVLLSSSLWTAIVALALGPTIMVGQNLVSLRGRADRDVWKGLLIFPIVGLVAGFCGQAIFSILLFFGGQNSMVLARSLGWMLLGAGLGIGLGALRGEFKTAFRGFLGGAVGGLVGGLFFDALGAVFSDGNAAFSRGFGLVVMGAAMAFCLKVAQETLKTAWLLGVSTGPYEGKESPLDKNQISVGRGSNCDLCLLRDETVPEKLGELVFQNGWRWRGNPVEIDGQIASDAPLQNGSILQLGTYKFRFMSRSRGLFETPQNAPIFASNSPATAPVSIAAPPKIAPQWASGNVNLVPLDAKFRVLEQGERSKKG